MFRFSTRSLGVLATVMTPLQRVAKRAIEISEVDFAVVQGKRTLDEQKRLYGKGRTAAECLRMDVPVSYARPNEAKVTWTVTRSNHLAGDAIDVAPYVDGKLNWDDNGKMGLWPKINKAFQQAARDCGVPIDWGGDGLSGTKTIDRPHFELRK